MRPTTIFEAGDIVRVPYPHVERPVMVPRPALVVNVRPLGTAGSLLWTLMITNAAREAWPGDIPIPDAAALGLIIPSKLRTAKISTVEAATASRIGRMPADVLAQVRSVLRETMSL